MELFHVTESVSHDEKCCSLLDNCNHEAERKRGKNDAFGMIHLSSFQPSCFNIKSKLPLLPILSFPPPEPNIHPLIHPTLPFSSPRFPFLLLAQALCSQLPGFCCSVNSLTSRLTSCLPLPSQTVSLSGKPPQKLSPRTVCARIIALL